MSWDVFFLTVYNPFKWDPTSLFGQHVIMLGQVPITFGEFNVSDVRPAQLFNIVVDIEGQLKWDESMSEATLVVVVKLLKID